MKGVMYYSITDKMYDKKQLKNFYLYLINQLFFSFVTTCTIIETISQKNSSN